MKLTNKLKVANAIYESDLSPVEKIVNLNCIKNLNEDELNVWIESEKLSEGKVAGAAKLLGVGLVGAVGYRAVKKRLDPCISNCRDIYKTTGDKEKYSNCLIKCNSK